MIVKKVKCDLLLGQHHTTIVTIATIVTPLTAPLFLGRQPAIDRACVALSATELSSRPQLDLRWRMHRTGVLASLLLKTQPRMAPWRYGQYSTDNSLASGLGTRAHVLAPFSGTGNHPLDSGGDPSRARADSVSVIVSLGCIFQSCANALTLCLHSPSTNLLSKKCAQTSSLCW